MTERRTGPYPIPDLHRAVRAEITAALNSDMTGAPGLPLSDGTWIGGSGDEREYLFSCKSWRDAFHGKRLLIRLSRGSAPWAPAQIQRMHDGKIKVVTAADLGSAPRNARLVEDDTAGLEILAEKLERAGDPNGPVNTTTANWLIGQGRPRVGRCDTPDRFISGYRQRQLNLRQRQAIEHALGSEITFIWGPPGTGKTEVVSCLVEGCYRQGLRVLFLAPTHVAVDQALERMCELLSQEAGFGDGLVQRAGDIALASLAARFGDRIVPERIAERLGAALDAEILRVTPQLEALRRDLAIHDEFDRSAAELLRLQQELVSVDQALVRIEEREQAAVADVAALRREITDIGVPSGFRAQRKQARLDQLQHQLGYRQHVLGLLEQERAVLRLDRQRHYGDLAAVQSALAPLQVKRSRLQAAADLRDLIARFEEHLAGLRDQLQKIAAAVRSRCRVMGTTVAKAVQSRKLMDTVDVVVIDEAGMVDLPSAWYAAGLAGKRVVVAGDFRQLPAVTRGSGDRRAGEDDKAHSRRWMDRDAFHAAGLVDERGTARSDARMISLNEQYRMRPAICAVVNEVAYPDAPLLTGRGDGSRLPASPLIDGPLVLIDTSARQVGDPKARNAHQSNPVHEAVIHELIRGLQYDTVLPPRKAGAVRPTDRLAVIAPYTAQKKALNTSLAYRFGEAYEGLVDTVHRFQGSQRPLVVIDTVAGAGSQLGYFYQGTGLSSSSCRLLNVALSRAQDHLVVVANVEFMRRNLPPGSEVAVMLDHLERDAQRLPVDELVPVRAAADLSGLDAEELARPAFFPADEVARAVEWDIARARSSIDIYCAFLYRTPVRKWLSHLSPRLAAGVRVTVHTRPPEPDSPAGPLVQELRDAGCEVVERERMHEKVLILDDTVLWHGSLNLLSHSGSTDLMMRFTDPSHCERVRRIMAQTRMDRPARKPPRIHSGQAASGSGEVKAGEVHNGHLYLYIPYPEKDEAKRLIGPMNWNASLRLWDVDAATPVEKVRRWLPRGT
ncbi:AAA domain-containing protein [Actinomadura hibisca]|uniref:AAA domain-containing protein n=1 Tax=Actinomadura hibisca TaxID=68565 RepID=UPI0008371ADF|nr:AAA domain-containing protein [Actinomadura hibisca]